MLPGKKYTAEDILQVALRRKWVLIGPFVTATMLAAAVSLYLPNTYRSETLIMLVPQRISDMYVKSPVTTRIEDRLNTLQDQILSRSRLERIIVDLGLYRPLRSTLPDTVILFC